MVKVATRRKVGKCNECGGSGYDRYPGPDGGQQQCRACFGSGRDQQAIDRREIARQRRKRREMVAVVAF